MQEMQKVNKNPPTISALEEYMTSVPKQYKENVKNMSLRMMSHPAYGRSYQWSVKDFEMGAPLGRGKFGRVYIARERVSKYLVAMKVLFKDELRRGNVEKRVLCEIEIQSHLKHPNILRLLTWFDDNKRIYLALELASEGELYRHLRNSKDQRFDEFRSAKYTYQVADALNYCHLNNVIHRDLKPENILLTSTDNIKLADFGWSAHTLSNRRQTFCGTLDYIPPEMVSRKHYDASVDQWCLGILCYEFLTGRAPFESSSSEKTYEKISNTAVHYPSHFSDGAKDLISSLLRKSSAERISLVDVMKHSWIKTNMAKRNEMLANCGVPISD